MTGISILPFVQDTNKRRVSAKCWVFLSSVQINAIGVYWKFYGNPNGDSSSKIWLL